MDVELKPCPFCGSTNLHHFEHCEGHESYGFQCGKCWMTGPQFGSKLEAVAAWNAREACKPEEAKAWAVYGTSDEFGPVMLNEYVGSMQVIRNRVMEAARREGFSGNFVERMAELGWWVEPLFHRHGAGDGEDAARYRWLRAEHAVNSPLAHVCWKKNGDRECGEWTNTAGPDSLDAAIDAARAGERG